MNPAEGLDWHELFDEICVQQGHSTNAELAQMLCAIKDRTSERDYQAALRSLTNWRNGTNLPHKANFRLLTAMLRVETNRQLLAHWRASYLAAKSRRDHLEVDAPAGDATLFRTLAGGVNTRTGVVVLAVALFATVTTLGSYWLVSTRGSTGLDVDNVENTRTISYRPYTELKVGESAIITARRGDCGRPPPPWNHFEHEMPLLLFGRFEDAGPGQSDSNRCRGLTPGRLVRYVATEPGTEIFDLFQRTLKVTVLPAEADGK